MYGRLIHLWFCDSCKKCNSRDITECKLSSEELEEIAKKTLKLNRDKEDKNMMYYITLIQGDSTTTCKVAKSKEIAKEWIRDAMHSMREDVYCTIDTYVIAGEDSYILLNKENNNLLCAWKIMKVEFLGE